MSGRDPSTRYDESLQEIKTASEVVDSNLKELEKRLKDLEDLISQSESATSQSQQEQGASHESTTQQPKSNTGSLQTSATQDVKRIREGIRALRHSLSTRELTGKLMTISSE